MSNDNYDLYDNFISTWYSCVVNAGYHQQRQYLDELLAIVPRGSSMLELGCGIGDLLIRLTKEGRICEGVDKSQPMLAALHPRHPHLVTYPLDVREFTPQASYDFVFSCNGIFSIKGNELESYLLEEDEVRDCLKRYCGISKNGLLINEGKSKSYLNISLGDYEFFHREFREKNIIVSIHILFDHEGKLVGERTHVKRRYPLSLFGEAVFTKITNSFYAVNI